MNLLPVHTFKHAIPAIAIAITLLTVSASADESVPLKGQAWETITGVSVVAGGIQVTTLGAGQSTHLGRFTRLARILINPDGTAEGITGWIGANGSSIILTLEAVPISATEFAGTYTVVFGNGRFAGATGESDFYASTEDGLTYDIAFSGEIDY